MKAPVKPQSARRLHRGHFAFMRALTQGLEPRASWDRYLRLEGEHTDLRTVRKTIAWIRDAFAAAAKRERRPGTARLILLDPDRFAIPTAQPSLEEFAQAQGLEEFSEAEQVEAYEAAYPQTAGSTGQGGAVGSSRRARVIARQLEALRWLEDLVAQDPRPGDGVQAWLNPSVAERLVRAGMPTLFTLVERINGVGARWWSPVPGVGPQKGARILEWLQANEDVLGLRVGHHVATPRNGLAPAALAAVVPAATALVPYEKFVLPAALDGSEGRFRSPPDRCLLMSRNDHEAIGAWLASKSAGGEGGELSSTQRAYRKEAERLLLWSILERKEALSSLSVEDATAFRAFLAAPPLSWCGPRHNQRWSPLWRPLEGPLAPLAARHALVVLRSLFTFLVSQGYVVGNPFAAVALPPAPQRPLGSSRTLTFSQWDHIDAQLQSLADTEVNRRLRRAILWLYATGLRLSEITRARCEHLEQVTYRTAEGASAVDWMLYVVGKGGRTRQVPVPSVLVTELSQELQRQGLEPQVSALSNQGVPVLARFDGADLEQPAPWSDSGLYQAIKEFLARAAHGSDEVSAEQLRRASTHWLRHSHGSHALQGRDGQTPVPIQVVQNNLGHASVGTTSMYLTTERDERLKAMRGFWKPLG